MPTFIIETTAESPIREFWKVEADNAEAAEAGFDDKTNIGEFLWDEVTGDETEREVAEVHAFADMEYAVRRDAAQHVALKLLDALKLCERALEERDTEAQAHAAKTARGLIADLTPAIDPDPDQWPGGDLTGHPGFDKGAVA